MTRVLIVEDSKTWQADFATGLASQVELLQAFTLKQGFRLFDQNLYFDAIFIDGCVDGATLDSIPLVQHIRQRHQGPLIAISSSRSYCRMLIEAGCDGQCLKADLPEYCLTLGLL